MEPRASARQCLDMLPIHWTSASGELRHACATVLEVLADGGVFHIDEPVAPGTRISVSLSDKNVLDAEVTGYESDEYGYYLSVQMAQAWFPDTYQPELIMLEEAEPGSESEPQALQQSAAK